MRVGYEEHKPGFGKWAMRAGGSGDKIGPTHSPNNQGPLMTISNKGFKNEDIVDKVIIPKKVEKKKPDMGIWGISNIKRKVTGIRKERKGIRDGIAMVSLKSWNRQTSANDSHDFGMSFCLDKTIGFEGIQEKPESDSQNGEKSHNEAHSPREENKGYARSSPGIAAQEGPEQHFNFSDCSLMIDRESRDLKAKSRNPRSPRGAGISGHTQSNFLRAKMEETHGSHYYMHN